MYSPNYSNMNAVYFSAFAPRTERKIIINDPLDSDKFEDLRILAEVCYNRFLENIVKQEAIYYLCSPCSMDYFRLLQKANQCSLSAVIRDPNVQKKICVINENNSSLNSKNVCMICRNFFKVK